MFIVLKKEINSYLFACLRETEEKENASDKEKKERIDENELKDNEKKNKEKGKQNKTGR